MKKTSATPRFSVVIPCYNEEHYIGDTLASLQQQVFDGTFEVIVVNNNCSDGSAKIAKELGARIVYEKRAGVCWARQAGTAAARGEIVISTDADTIFTPQWLQTIDETFKQHSDYVAVAGPCTYRSGPWWGRTYPKLLFRAVDGYCRLFGRPFYITATNIAFKKSFWQGYDVNTPQGGDELSLLRQLRKQGKVAFVRSNPVYTSARRLKRGLLYNLFVTLIFYYLCGYYLDRIFRRTIIGPAPAYRFSDDEETKTENARLQPSVLLGNKLND